MTNFKTNVFIVSDTVYSKMLSKPNYNQGCIVPYFILFAKMQKSILHLLGTFLKP